MVHTHTPKPICEQEDITDREVTANGTDIIIKNKKEKTCLMVGVTISADVMQKQRERS
jgi:hypothetical protein